MAGYLAKIYSWLKIQLPYLGAAFLLTITVMLLTQGNDPGATENWYEAPPLAFVFAIVGFFLGPIYPTISSIVLTRLDKAQQSAMTGLIIIFSALGGTSGSLILGRLTDVLNTHDAFFWPLVPMILLSLMLIPYKRLADR